MATTLQEMVENYWADRTWQKEKFERTQRRTTALPQVTSITRNFVAGDSTLQMFCDQMNESFRSTGERWGAQGNSFMLPMFKIIKHHDDKTPVAESRLRDILTNLTSENIGIKIEELYTFLLAERSRLRQEGKPSGVAAEAGKSSLIISLFAFWLRPEQEPIVYHEGVRNGLALLIKKQLFTPSQSLRINRDVVTITTNSDYQATQQAIHELLAIDPSLKNSPYWSEFFFYWLVSSFQKQNQSASTQPTLIKQPDEAGVLATDLNQSTIVREALANDTSNNGSVQLAVTIDDDPLAPTPKPLLNELIREIQRHILVEETTIRDIYHALLAGHVILSGPPGTGKTELARLIPEILWKSAENDTEADEDEQPLQSSRTAYTTRLVTATDEWSVRTLISGITPVSKNGSVAYKVQYGHLTSAILKNWTSQSDNPEDWNTLTLRRSPVTSSGGVERGTPQTFRGQWLVIDEFNRAPIDLALGDALTALGGNDVLRVAIEGGSAELPIPKDFRIIGTLNSFDRNYLNQISEALKRRFSFVEILPPGRSLRAAEQAIVLYKALERVSHLSTSIISDKDIIIWENLSIETGLDSQYSITWPDEPSSFREAFEAAWHIFEVIRIYRQLGTAQAISMIRHMLIAGILQGYTTREEWIGKALDAALCDTIADQLQVLLPDEIEALLLFLTSERSAFSAAYNRLLGNLADRPQRLYSQLLKLSNTHDENGVAYLSDEEIEAIAQSSKPEVTLEKLAGLFHLDAPASRLPQFTRRLRAFKAERGL
ncbi:MAG TPA: AAA family ATPase [Ktedonobacteraceae bacterium]|nr:AAA family ATPase [Ktedonobacteraceae bacterium]